MLRAFFFISQFPFFRTPWTPSEAMALRRRLAGVAGFLFPLSLLSSAPHGPLRGDGTEEAASGCCEPPLPPQFFVLAPLEKKAPLHHHVMESAAVVGGLSQDW